MNKGSLIVAVLVLTAGTLDVLTSYWGIAHGAVELNRFHTVLPFAFPAASLSWWAIIKTVSDKTAVHEFKDVDLDKGTGHVVTKDAFKRTAALVAFAIFIVGANFGGPVNNLMWDLPRGFPVGWLAIAAGVAAALVAVVLFPPKAASA
jgi:hypothetical protein